MQVIVNQQLMLERKYKVYCHRNKTTGKEYIGMTGRDINVRWSSKKRAYDMCTYFRRALEEYGWDGFEHIVLYDGLTKEEAVEKETELIRENISKGISYNVRDDNDWLGNLRKRPVDVYDLQGNLIETCASIHDVCVKYDSGETHTYYCVTGKKKTLKRKYILAFHGEDISNRIAEANIDRRYGLPAHNRRKVAMFSLEGNKIREFDSATEASNYVSVGVSSIVSCCSGVRKTCRGYKWSYV